MIRGYICYSATCSQRYVCLLLLWRSFGEKEGVLWVSGLWPSETIMPLFQLARFLEDHPRASETLADPRLRIDEDLAHIIDSPL